ncbi:hypothetical protein ADUPG1_008572 [Aduncisulcus paluster]|uniref:Uncharacterized protein n=1 Tax=Aduncisulcus paluster TaxID=2918883 RepID=A0ABQ5KSG0_9EUKA|nr:hypothetical protein ADUPG1_008572 [Aduncisulcus paluster]
MCVDNERRSLQSPSISMGGKKDGSFGAPSRESLTSSSPSILTGMPSSVGSSPGSGRLSQTLLEGLICNPHAISPTLSHSSLKMLPSFVVFLCAGLVVMRGTIMCDTEGKSNGEVMMALQNLTESESVYKLLRISTILMGEYLEKMPKDSILKQANYHTGNKGSIGGWFGDLFRKNGERKKKKSAGSSSIVISSTSSSKSKKSRKSDGKKKGGGKEEKTIGAWFSGLFNRKDSSPKE